jgi:hypothetical protein
MSHEREHWTADEAESFIVILVCAGMMSFGGLFYIAGKTATHATFQHCLRSGCDDAALMRQSDSQEMRDRLRSIDDELRALRMTIASEGR